MNALMIKILAVGLTLSQLFTKPVENFHAQFDAKADQAQVSRLLHDGCQFVTKEFGAEQINFDFLFSTMVANIKNAKENATAQPTGPQGMTAAGLIGGLDVPTMYAAYKEFCKNENVQNSPIDLAQVIAYYNQTLANLPDAAQLKGKRLPETTTLLDRHGDRFTEIFSDRNRRKWVSIQDIPLNVQNAFVAAEDKRFFEHHGVDIRGIIRAFASSISSSTRPQGGSTITQQVVKNLLVGDDLTFERKIREMVVAARLERLLSKREILELYLNFVFLGRASWGVEMASESYFGKSVKQLDLAEAATLAGLVRGPNYYSPDLHPERIQERREYVLSRMKEDDKNHTISEAALKQALAEKPKLAEFESPKSRAGFYFVDEVVRASKAAGIPSLTSGSYVIHSTIDRDLQKVTEQSLQDGLEQYSLESGQTGDFEPVGSLATAIDEGGRPWREALASAHADLYDVHWPLGVVLETGTKCKVGLPDGRVVPLTGPNRQVISSLGMYDLVFVRVNESKRATTASMRSIPEVQGAAIVMEAKTGRILALDGGFSYAASQLDRATQSARQPGSTLKPFIYLAALNKGFQPNTLIPDAPLSLPPIDRGGKWWSPHDFDDRVRGLVTIREAIEHSLNLPTARIMTELGPTPAQGLDAVREVTKELGIYSDPVRYYPFVLGAQPARLIDLAAAYATIANIGLRPTPHFIDRIDLNSRPVYQPGGFPLQPVPGIDRVSFFQIRRILEGPIARGTAIQLKDLAGYVAGKTGTSNNENDAWFIAFTNDLVVAVWVGYDSRRVHASLGSKYTGAKLALPIAEKILRASFDIYKKPEDLSGAPPEIKNQIVEYPIDHDTGEFNAGRFYEVFRAQSPGQPRDTWRAILRPGEDQLAFGQEPPDDDEWTDPDGEAAREFSPGYDRAPHNPYQPGPEDMYEYWRQRQRRIDNFFQNPYGRGYGQ